MTLLSSSVSFCTSLTSKVTDCAGVVRPGTTSANVSWAGEGEGEDDHEAVPEAAAAAGRGGALSFRPVFCRGVAAGVCEAERKGLAGGAGDTWSRASSCLRTCATRPPDALGALRAGLPA